MMFDVEVPLQNAFSEREITCIHEEYSRLKGVCYLDHTGCPPYSDSVIKNSLLNLTTNVYGNPHSGSLSSKFCLDNVDQVRYRILQHFNTSANEYSVIFTSGATASLKLVAESFVWSKNDNPLQEGKLEDGKSFFVYTEDNHTSVLGMRPLVTDKGVEVISLEHERAFDVFNHTTLVSKCESRRNSLFAYSAQSNFSGVKYPLKWINGVHSGVLDSVCEGKSDWYCLLDAATYVSTNKLDLSLVKPDFVAVSFYKMFGFPTGLGALLVLNSSSHLLQKTYYGGGTVFMALSKENSYVPRAVLHERFEDGTINFLSIISLIHGFDFLEKIDLDKISKHCFEMAHYAYLCLSRLHHSNGSPATIIYNDTPYDDITTQGNILNFNLLRPNGEYIGFAEVLNLANLHGIHLRTGCFCNPGACRRHLNLTTEDVKKHFSSGHVCGDDFDLVDGQPTGSIRISFGHYTTVEDVDKLLRMIVDCFVQKPIIQKYPIDWDIRSQKLSSKFVTEKSQTVSSEERLKSMCSIYFWLENIDTVLPDCYLGYKETHVMENFCSTKSEPIYKTNRQTKVHLSHMFVYPIKSCGRFHVDKWEISLTGLKYDREWMVTNHAGVALTQKSEPRLCLIKPIIDLDSNKLILTFKGYPKLSLELEGSGREPAGEVWLCSSKVCGDQVQGVDCGESASLWLSHVLGREGLRLVRQRQRHSSTEGALSLSNQAQYLMINKTSVDWLADKLDEIAECKRESMLDRFRSNFVVSGLDLPFEEQLWKTVKIGNQNFKVDGPCGRCQMICIDQETGIKTKEPLTTLASSFKGKLKFGIYLSSEETKLISLSVGNQITFLLD